MSARAARSAAASTATRHGPVCASAARSAAPWASSAVMRAGFACTFHGHACGGNHCNGGRQEGGLGGTWNRGRDFPGPGAVPGSPQL